MVTTIESLSNDNHAIEIIENCFDSIDPKILWSAMLLTKKLENL